MPLPISIRVPSTLNLTFNSEHFIIHYGLRNPLNGKGLGRDGVRDLHLITTYSDALENLYSTMTSPPWNRSAPITGEDGKTHVYVFNSGLGPFTVFDEQKSLYIVLSSRNNEPTTGAELNRAASEAVHEATHLFNYTHRPFEDINSKPWEWFDEGLAVLMETIVAPKNPDYHRFLMDWIDSPELPLDHPAGKYHAGMFVQYLGKRVGLDYVNKVWTESHVSESPLDALERLLPDGQRFFSADCSIRDIFASGYCIDPYCLWEHASEVFLRFGERAISESLVLPKDTNYPVEGYLDHLACRYYRFYLEQGVSRVEIKMQVDGPCHKTRLKAEMAIVTKARQRNLIQALSPITQSNSTSAQFVGVLESLNPEDIDHLVLVVSNCGTRSAINWKLTDHDDAQRFIITASTD